VVIAADGEIKSPLIHGDNHKLHRIAMVIERVLVGPLFFGLKRGHHGDPRWRRLTDVDRMATQAR
jgi:hypothetical protein